MTDRLAHVLAAAFPDHDPAQLAEAVLLAARWTGPAGEERLSAPAVAASDPADPVAPTSSPKAADLTLPVDDPDPLGVGGGAARVTEVGLRLPPPASPTLTTATALSLFRRVHRPGPPVVDVDATVEATADAGRLVVVARPGRARGLDVAIVVDPTPVALVWADTITELEGTLRRTGAFRTVTRWTLDRAASGEPRIRDSAGVPHHAGQLVDPAGRRLVLLLTDGTGDEWRDAGVWQVLRRWARAMPTTLIHLLPPSYWGYTAVGQPTSVVRSLRPADPNATLETRAAWWSDVEITAADVPVPVLDLDADAIVRWSQAVVSGSAWTEAVWARSPAVFVDMSPDLSATDQLAVFEMRATDGAQRLARLLAGAPVLSLPLIRVLHEHLTPAPATSQIAELLVSGLLERLPDDPSLLLKFRPGVAELLYRGTTVTQEWDLYDLLSGYLERNAGTGNQVRALVTDPAGALTMGSNLVPFATMGRGMARRLGLPLDQGEPGSVGGVAEPRRYLLLCTIGEYGPTIPSLFLDAESARLAQLFTSLGYTIIPIASGYATRMDVLDRLTQFYHDPDRRPDDLVVLYLTGHSSVQNDEFCLLVSDTQADRMAATSISMPALADLFFHTRTVGQILVVVDTSHSGLGASHLARSPSVPWFGVLASAGEHQASRGDLFTNAFVATVEEWLNASAEPTLSLDQLVRGVNHRLGTPDQQAKLHFRSRESPSGPAFFARPPALPARSSYGEVIRRIAPEQLLNRDDELDELSAFCTAADPAPRYLLLRGGHLAGKTALLAAFALAPPPGTKVVSFFLTTRSRDERDRFTEVVSEQLAEILGEPLGPVSEQRLVNLIERAAESCRRAGERLVLVVDGLADGESSTSRERANEVLPLLPPQPPAGMRIIVSARPGWKIPHGTPEPHQLRSPHVMRIGDWALPPADAPASRDEIRENVTALLRDQVAGDLIGLLTAAGGGLSAEDLIELTGLRATVVKNALVRARRILTDQPGRVRAEPAVHQLFHELARELAADEIGETRLAEYRARLDEWAQQYARHRWPPDTPDYLLYGYFLMLLAAGAVPEMTRLIMDAHRQDRLFIETGSSEHSLSEVRALLDAAGGISSIESRLYDALLRTIVALEERATDSPLLTPDAWVEMGDLSRAEAAARRIEDPAERSAALARVAEASEAAGDFERAEALTEGISNHQRFARNEDVSKNEMVEWFLEIYADPASCVPYSSADGGYQYLGSGPYYASDILHSQFPDAPEETIEAALEVIEGNSFEWVKKSEW